MNLEKYELRLDITEFGGVYSNISVEETWSPSVKLKYKKVLVTSLHYHDQTEKILQQLFISNLGNTEWRDITTE